MSDLETINKAFLAAFTEDDLRQLVKFGLDVDLSAVVDGGNLRSVIFALTNWAVREGRLVELVHSARTETQNPLIQKLNVDPSEYFFPVVGEVVGSKMDNLIQVKFQADQLDKQISKLERIVTGEDGVSGIRQICLDNQRSIEMLVTRSNDGPNLLGQKSSRYIFFALFVFLLLILAVSSGALSSFGIG